MITYSQAILSGLKSKGIPLAKLRVAGRIPAPILAAVSKGKRQFTDSQLTKIEDLSGFTAGQLAALNSEPNGGPLTDLFNAGAKVFRLEKISSARSAKKLRRKSVRKLTPARVG